MSAQLDRLHRLKAETLLGERGKRDDHAVRFRDLKSILAGFEEDVARRIAIDSGLSGFSMVGESFSSASFSLMGDDAHIEAEPLGLVDSAQELAAWRAAVSIPRSTLCIGLYRLGLLSAEDAIEAGKGNWPASLGGFDAVSDVMDPTEAEILWAAATVIPRNDPLFEAMRAHLQMTPEAADTLFGYITTAE